MEVFKEKNDGGMKYKEVLRCLKSDKKFTLDKKMIIRNSLWTRKGLVKIRSSSRGKVLRSMTLKELRNEL